MYLKPILIESLLLIWAFFCIKKYKSKTIFTMWKLSKNTVCVVDNTSEHRISGEDIMLFGELGLKQQSYQEKIFIYFF